MAAPPCRACANQEGEIVLDLGNQPACDYFPAKNDPRPDPVYPLQMWLCTRCGLAQLVDDPTVPEEPRGAEPVALITQAADAVQRVADAALLRSGMTAVEYGSPHGGSWASLLADRDIAVVPEGPGDVVLDCFGLMHRADQAAALAQRAARVAPDGLLLIQYHSLATIVQRGQWNSLRHGHYAYYSTAALGAMLAAEGFTPLTAWQFELYGGTVLLAATRRAGERRQPDPALRALTSHEDRLRVRDPERVRILQSAAAASAAAVRDWLAKQRAAGTAVLGYGAASRAVALLCLAGIDSGLLPAIADASQAKQGRRMPGTDIPVIEPEELVTYRPDVVLLFLPDLLPEVQDQLPEVVNAGGQWVDVESLTTVT